jgi:hypothetical protein
VPSIWCRNLENTLNLLIFDNPFLQGAVDTNWHELGIINVKNLWFMLETRKPSKNPLTMATILAILPGEKILKTLQRK